MRSNQIELWNFDAEALSIFGDEMVKALHAACGGVQGAGTVIFKGLTRLDFWLHVHDARAADFFFVATGICDDPVTTHQLSGRRA